MNVLTILTNGFEEIETVTPLDLLHRAGAKNTIVSVAAGKETSLKGRSDLTLKTDMSLDALLEKYGTETAVADAFDALFIPGGPGTWTLLDDGNAPKLAAAFAAKNKPIAAICAAPLILKAAGLLENKRVSAHFCTWEEIPAAQLCAPVTLDGNLLTSRGAGTAFAFGLAFAELLCGKSVAEKLAAETMA